MTSDYDIRTFALADYEDLMNTKIAIMLVSASLVLVTATACARQLSWEDNTAAGTRALTGGRHAEAEQYLQAAVKQSELFDPKDGRVADSQDNLADVYMATQEYARAIPLRQRALELREGALGAESADLVPSLDRLGRAYFYNNQFDKAEEPLRRALAIYEKHYGPDDPRVAIRLEQLGGTYINQKRYAEAEQMLSRVIAIREKSLPPNDPSLASAYTNLAALYSAQGRPADAEGWYRRSIAVLEKGVAQDVTIASNLRDLANALVQQQKVTDALPMFQRAISLFEKTDGPNSPRLVAILEEYSGALSKTGNEEAAQTAMARAKAIRMKT
jgi:tetratricopeptide (TPR) repeat protein